MGNKKIVSVKSLVPKRTRLMLTLCNRYYEIGEKQYKKIMSSLSDDEVIMLIKKFDSDRIKLHSHPEDVYKLTKEPWYKIVLEEYLKFFLIPEGKKYQDLDKEQLSIKSDISKDILFKRAIISQNLKSIKIQGYDLGEKMRVDLELKNLSPKKIKVKQNTPVSIESSGIDFFEYKLRNIDFKEGNIKSQTRFFKCELENINFISDIKMSQVQYILSNLKNVIFEKDVIKDCIFQGEKIEGGSIDGIQDTSIKDVELERLNFTGEIKNLDSFKTKYRNVNFQNVEFGGTECGFIRNTFISSKFYKTNLEEDTLLVFNESRFIKTSFEEADLSGADFKGVLMAGVIFKKVKLDGCDFNGAKFDPNPKFKVDFTECGCDLTKILNFGSKYIKNFLKAQFTRKQIEALRDNGQISKKEAYIYLCEMDLAKYIKSPRANIRTSKTALVNTIKENKEFMADLVPIFAKRCKSGGLDKSFLVGMVDEMPEECQGVAIEDLLVIEAFVKKEGLGKLYKLAKKLKKNNDYLFLIYKITVGLKKTCPSEFLEQLYRQKLIKNPEFKNQLSFLFKEHLRQNGKTLKQIKKTYKGKLLELFQKHKKDLTSTLIDLIERQKIGFEVFDYFFNKIENQGLYLEDEVILMEYITNGAVEKLFAFQKDLSPEFVKEICKTIVAIDYEDEDFSKTHEQNIKQVKNVFLKETMKEHRKDVFKILYKWLIEQGLNKDLRGMWRKVDLDEGFALFKKLFVLLHKSTKNNNNKKYRDLMIVDTLNKCEENKELQLSIFNYILKKNRMSDIELTAVFGGAGQGINSFEEKILGEIVMADYEDNTKKYFRLLNILDVNLIKKISVFGTNRDELGFDLSEFVVSCLYRIVLPRKKIGEEDLRLSINLYQLTILNKLCVQGKTKPELNLFKTACEKEADKYGESKERIKQLLPFIIYTPKLKNLNLKSFFRFSKNKPKQEFTCQKYWDFDHIKDCVVNNFIELSPEKLEIYLYSGSSDAKCNEALKEFFLKKINGLDFKNKDHFLVVIRTLDFTIKEKMLMYQIKYPKDKIAEDKKFLRACMESMLRKEGITFQDIIELKKTFSKIGNNTGGSKEFSNLSEVIFNSYSANTTNKQTRSLRDAGYFNGKSFLTAWETMEFGSCNQLLFISRVVCFDRKDRALA
ncbi:pentapeptide repeat-containing protein, partial [Candidatus Margulisiibacteriota bacterium]